MAKGLSRDYSNVFLKVSFSAKDNCTFYEQHERLNTSLAALTRHVAHVQFRLHQVISAPTSEDREVGQYIDFYSASTVSVYIEFTSRIT